MSNRGSCSAVWGMMVTWGLLPGMEVVSTRGLDHGQGALLSTSGPDNDQGLSCPGCHKALSWEPKVPCVFAMFCVQPPGHDHAPWSAGGLLFNNVPCSAPGGLMITRGCCQAVVWLVFNRQPRITRGCCQAGVWLVFNRQPRSLSGLCVLSRVPLS